MKARDVIGKRIVRIVHERWYNEHLKRHETDCIVLVLEDGTRIIAEAYETVEQPAVTMHAIRIDNK